MNTSTRSAETLKTLCLGLSYVFSYAYISLFASSYQALGITIFLTLLSLGAILWLELSIRQQTLLGRFSPSKIQKVETRFWEVILILLSISTYRGGQMHHTLRYGKRGLWKVVVYGDITEGEKESFRYLAERNAVNDGYQRSEVVFLGDLSELEGVL